MFLQFRISLCQWLAVPSCLSVLACPGGAILQEASKEENRELGTVEDNTENEGVEQPRSSTKMSIGKDEEQRALGAKVLDRDTRIYTFGFVNCMSCSFAWTNWREAVFQSQAVKVQRLLV